MGIVEVKNVYNSFLDEVKPSLRSVLSKNQKRVVVLKDISFEVDAGELLGVIGRNGAGKSTLLKLIGGIYEKDSGNIITQGDIVSIFELGSFFNVELTGEQYCKDYFLFRGLKGKMRDEVIEEIHKFTELGNYFYEPIKTYSSGMKAKLLFGAATAIPAKIILIDEFLVVGDEYFQGKAWDRLRGFLNSGTTGIIVSHDWTSIMKLCKRTLILSDGRIDYIGETYQVIQKYLNIPYVESDEVSFMNKSIMTANPVYARTGEPFLYEYSIEVHDKFRGEGIGVGFSIERHIEGIGWSLAMTGVGTVSYNNEKTMKILISIEDFCLAAGEYLLCLFLNTPLKKGQRSVDKGYESLTWLNGHPIKLIVPGTNDSKQLIRKRLKWKISCISS